MTNELWIVQPITIVGLALISAIIPAAIGFVYFHFWRTIVPWLIASAISIACLTSGIELTQQSQVDFAIDPTRTLIVHVVTILAPALIFLFLGAAVSILRLQLKAKNAPNQ